MLEIDGRISDEETAQVEQALMRQRRSCTHMLQRRTGQFTTNGMHATATRSRSRSCSSPIPCISAKLARGDSI